MSRKHKNSQPDPDVNTAKMLDVLQAGSQQTPKKSATQYPKIKLPVQEPDASKPLDWFSAYQRHADRD